MLRYYMVGLLALQLSVGLRVAVAAEPVQPAAQAPTTCCIDPYPAGPDGKKAEGVVIVRACYAANGVVVSAIVKESSGHGELDAAAIKDVSAFAAERTAKGDPPKVGCRNQKITFKAKPAEDPAKPSPQRQ